MSPNPRPLEGSLCVFARDSAPALHAEIIARLCSLLVDSSSPHRSVAFQAGCPLGGPHSWGHASRFPIPFHYGGPPWHWTLRFLCDLRVSAVKSHPSSPTHSRSPVTKTFIFLALCSQSLTNFLPKSP